MSEMVNRVAKALEIAFDREGRVFDQEQSSDLARAAIEAMRVPTEEMMLALRFYGMLDGDAEYAWEKTIDSAIDPTAPLVDDL